MLNSKEKFKVILLDDKSLEKMSGGSPDPNCDLGDGKLSHPTLNKVGFAVGTVGLGIDIVCCIACMSCYSKSKKIKDQSKRKKYLNDAKRLFATTAAFMIPGICGFATWMVTGCMKAGTNQSETIDLSGGTNQ